MKQRVKNVKGSEYFPYPLYIWMHFFEVAIVLVTLGTHEQPMHYTVCALH